MPLSPGSQVAGYKVVSLLGSGGMGEVYLVENPQLLRREALKVISLAGAHDPDFQRRFTNEARTTAALDHPSIISIHQYGINTDGTPWFTMNYLEGADLTHGAISPSDVIEVTTRVADALDYAHRRNIIHRDVKPANVFVSRDEHGQIARVTVLDFGIAKLVNSTSLTATSAFIGTLAYCAPEVIEGHDASASSDQYSLACTVFQLLTGQAPFTTTTPSALVMAHLTKQIPPISSLRPDLGALDPVIAKALSKNPADRYPDCRSFSTALRQAFEGRGNPTPPPQQSNPGGRTVRRGEPPVLPAHRATVAANAAAVVCDTAAVASEPLASKPLGAQPESVLPRPDTGRDARRLRAGRPDGRQQPTLATEFAVSVGTVRRARTDRRHTPDVSAGNAAAPHRRRLSALHTGGPEEEAHRPDRLPGGRRRGRPARPRTRHRLRRRRFPR